LAFGLWVEMAVPASSSRDSPCAASSKSRAAEQDEGEEAEEDDAGQPRNPLVEKFKPGQWVEIIGLDSDGGRKLNGAKGTIVRYVYEKIRFEIQLVDKVVSVRPVNLQKTERPDVKWQFGDTCRLVGLREHEDERLREKSGQLGVLHFRGSDGLWKVSCGGEPHKVQPHNLLVCAEDDELGLWSPDFSGRCVLWSAVVVTTGVILGAAFAMVKLHFAPAPILLFELPELHPSAPGYFVAALSFLVVSWAFLWLCGTLWGCCRLNACLADPNASLPLISELYVGSTSAKMLFSWGFGIVAALLLATVLLYGYLVLPRMPWSSYESSQVEDAMFWGVAAAVGIGAYGRTSWPRILHRLSAALVLWSCFKHLGATSLLYFPRANKPWAAYLLGVEEPFGETGAEVAVDPIEEARAQAAESEFLRHPMVSAAVLVRHHILTRMPWCVLLAPVFTSALDRIPGDSKVSATTMKHSMLTWAEWILVLNGALIHLSYAPELVAASLLPMSGQDPDAV